MVDNLVSQTYTTQRKNIFLMVLAMLTAGNLTAEVSVSANLFLGRSFSANITREMLMTGPNNQFSNGGINGFFAIDAAYQRAWQQSETQGIGAYPFWSQTNSMTVGNYSGESNIDAYQFGLGPVNTTGSISLNPIIYQNGSDFMFYVRGKQYGWSPFAKIKSAITAMVVNPGLTEPVAVTPQPYAPGALQTSSTLAYTPAPSTSMIQAFAGVTGTQKARDDFRPMQYGLINGTQSTGAHFSDTEMTVGYNYTCDETDNTVSFGLRVTAPTGVKPDGVYILQPINGRGGNWGVGFYLAGEYQVWHNEPQEHALKLNFMSNGIHLCSAEVIRSYDLTANGHGSKYLLVADYQNGVYQNSVQNLVNLSTLTSTSSFAFEGDAALGISYSHRGFSVDLGYEAWGRTAEKLTISENVVNNRYAVLGRQPVGYDNLGAENPVNACQPLAMINLSNPNVAQAIPSTDATVTSQSSIVNATVAANRISGTNALNTAITAQYAAVTSKIFAKIGYNWRESQCCPYLNLVGECEWSNISNNALPQWGIVLMGGISL